MTPIKPLYCLVILAFVWTSCGGIKKLAVPAGAEDVVALPAKKGKLTEAQLNRWGHADLETDTLPGLSLAKAYEFVKGKPSQTVIVAVADTGLDLEHEDLKDKLWTNPKELKGNGKDDDGNEYFKLENETPKPFFQIAIQHIDKKQESPSSEEEKTLLNSYIGRLDRSSSIYEMYRYYQSPSSPYFVQMAIDKDEDELLRDRMKFYMAMIDQIKGRRDTARAIFGEISERKGAYEFELAALEMNKE